MEDPDGGSGWMRWMRMRDIGRTADGVRTHMDYLDPLHNSPYGAIIYDGLKVLKNTIFSESLHPIYYS